jgi:hypothetical protein
MTNEEKEHRFKHPDPEEPYLDRGPVSDVTKDTLISVTYLGSQGKERPLVGVSTPGADGPNYFPGEEGWVHSPGTVEAGNNRCVFWSEFVDTDRKPWLLRAAPFSVAAAAAEGLGKGEVLYRSEDPVSRVKAGALPGGRVFFLWEELGEERIVIRSAVWDPDEKSFSDHTLSDPSFDAFRPDLWIDLSGPDARIWAVWDRYRDEQYEVVLSAAVVGAGDSGSASVPPSPVFQLHSVFRCRGEDWNAPRLLGIAGNVESSESSGEGRRNGAGSTIFCIWRSTTEVWDDRGIFDRCSAVKGVKIDGENIVFLEDPEHPEKQTGTCSIPEAEGKRTVIGDLREGLLARELTKGYVGLRRNPQIFSFQGVPCIAWEVRPESTKTSVKGQLVGRTIGEDGKVRPAVVLHRGGYCYSVPKVVEPEGNPGEKIPISFFEFEREGEEILQSAWVGRPGKGAGEEYKLRYSDWNRWHREAPDIDRQGKGYPSENILMNDAGGTYNLYWGDTHCHTIMSPDAEGDPDEFIHYARRNAGLNLLGMVDNDFYPHKSITRCEWEIKKALSDRFSVSGEFLCPPSYEYTYHDPSLSPDFNHRCVLHFLEGDLIKRTDPGNREIEKFLKRIDPEKTLVYIHHCAYRLTTPEVERNAEVVSSWRVCMEETNFTLEQLKKGQKIGFIGSSDTHRQVPGRGGALTGVFAEELTPEAVLDAYNNRRLIATQGSKVLIDFRINGVFIGGTLKRKGGDQAPLSITCRVQGPSDLERITIIKDGNPLLEKEIDGVETELTITDSEISRGGHFYFAKVKLKGEPSLNMEKKGEEKGEAKGGTEGPERYRPFTNESLYPHNLARGRGVFAWTSPIWVEES